MDRLSCLKHLPRYTESNMKKRGIIMIAIKESPLMSITVVFHMGIALASSLLLWKNNLSKSY